MENIIINIMVGLAVMLGTIIMLLFVLFVAVVFGVWTEKIVAKTKHNKYFEFDSIVGIIIGLIIESIILMIAYFIGNLF